MIGGKPLKEEYQGGDILDFLNRNLGGKHFGKFSSYEEGMESDSLLHEWFNNLKKWKSVGKTTEDKVIDYLKEQ